MFDIIKTDAKSRARLGLLRTEHGNVETPAYVIVGTHAAVRCLEPRDLIETKIQLIIANTYHLWRDMSDDELNNYPGLHEAMEWQGPIMTDSGGFQIFSLGFLREYGMRRGMSNKNDPSSPIRANRQIIDNENKISQGKNKNLVRITESGVHFRPDEEAEDEQYLDAELSIKIQEQLGADIIVAFDEATAPTADHGYAEQAMGRTHAWAVRSLEAKQSSSQKIYGVVQGGSFEDLRTASAKYIGGLPFDGFGIGSTYGDAYGGTKSKTAEMLAWSISHLPERKPRHLFGVGKIEDLLNGVEAGVDTFDCVIPTREARHGALWTSCGRIDIKKGKYADDGEVINEACTCPVCLENPTERRELHRLFKNKDPMAGRIATIHNVYFFNDFMEKIRGAIAEGRLPEFKKEYLKTFSAAGK